MQRDSSAEQQSVCTRYKSRERKMESDIAGKFMVEEVGIGDEPMMINNFRTKENTGRKRNG